jgi:hypothetical protein
MEACHEGGWVGSQLADNTYRCYIDTNICRFRTPCSGRGVKQTVARVACGRYIPQRPNRMAGVAQICCRRSAAQSTTARLVPGWGINLTGSPMQHGPLPTQHDPKMFGQSHPRQLAPGKKGCPMLSRNRRDTSCSADAADGPSGDSRSKSGSRTAERPACRPSADSAHAGTRFLHLDRTSTSALPG